MNLGGGRTFLPQGATIPLSGVEAMAPAAEEPKPISTDWQGCGGLVGETGAGVLPGALGMAGSTPGDPCQPGASGLVPRPTVCIVGGRPHVPGAREACEVLQLGLTDPAVAGAVGLVCMSVTGGGGSADASDVTGGTGPLRDPAFKPPPGEDELIDSSRGLQSRKTGLFENVVFGQHGDPATRYLWTIERGINLAFEQTAAATERKHIVHSDISARASIAGEAWFQEGGVVTINAGSGRWGDRGGATAEQWTAAVKYWERLGYTVNALPLGTR